MIWREPLNPKDSLSHRASCIHGDLKHPHVVMRTVGSIVIRLQMCRTHQEFALQPNRWARGSDQIDKSYSICRGWLGVRGWVLCMEEISLLNCVFCIRDHEVFILQVRAESRDAGRPLSRSVSASVSLQSVRGPEAALRPLTEPPLISSHLLSAFFFSSCADVTPTASCW